MSYRNFAEYPLRLTDVERQQMSLVIAALKVSEYTDEVDDNFRRKFSPSRAMRSMQDFFDTVVGLALASDAVLKKTRDKLTRNPELASYAPLLGELFEVVRRHKQLNPRSNQSEFGKLMLILQDSQNPSLQRSMGFPGSVVLPIKTVGAALRAIQQESMLQDPELERFLAHVGEKKQSYLKGLVKKYATTEETREVIERCVKSIDDVETLILTSIDPLITLQTALNKEFKENGGHSRDRVISISRGRGGSMLTHSHDVHCQYVMESLVLWELVQRNILSLWRSTEQDMLFDSSGQYEFVNTGQGYQRMCKAPNSYAVMSRCLNEAQNRMNGQWVGIKVIHLGDRDVPNPLVFIDKYTQVPGLVYPVTHTLKELHSLFSNSGGGSQGTGKEVSYPGISNLLRHKYSSLEALRIFILADFFKHAFDGSGDDGGSCIDGRLTSAWNWCQELSKKPYYEAFLLSGFLGFG